MNPPQEGLERPQASVLMLPLSPHFSLSIAFLWDFVTFCVILYFMPVSFTRL